jgi:hypothetical protein
MQWLNIVIGVATLIALIEIFSSFSSQDGFQAA